MTEFNYMGLYGTLDRIIRQDAGFSRDSFALAGALVAYMMAAFRRAGEDAARVEKLNHDISELILAFGDEENE